MRSGGSPSRIHGTAVTAAPARTIRDSRYADETKTPGAAVLKAQLKQAAQSPFRHESSLRSEMLQLHRNRVAVPPPMTHAGAKGMYYDKANPRLRQSVRKAEKKIKYTPRRPRPS